MRTVAHAAVDPRAVTTSATIPTPKRFRIMRVTSCYASWRPASRACVLQPEELPHDGGIQGDQSVGYRDAEPAAPRAAAKQTLEVLEPLVQPRIDATRTPRLGNCGL